MTVFGKQFDPDVCLGIVHVLENGLPALRRIKSDQHGPSIHHIDVVRLAGGVEMEGIGAILVRLGGAMVEGEILLDNPALAVIRRHREEASLVEVQRRDRQGDPGRLARPRFTRRLDGVQVRRIANRQSENPDRRGNQK